VLDVNGDGRFDFLDIQLAFDFNKDGKLCFGDVVHALDLNKDGKVDFQDVVYALDLNKDGKVDLKDFRCAEDLLVVAIEGQVHEAEEAIRRAVVRAEAQVLRALECAEEANALFASELRQRVVCELSYRERLEVFFRAFPAVLVAPGGLRARIRRVRRCCFILFGDFKRNPRGLRFQRGDSVVSVVIARVVARHLQRVSQSRGFDLDGDGFIGLHDLAAMADMTAVIGSSVIGAAYLDGNFEGAAASVRDAGLAVQFLEHAAEAKLEHAISEAKDRVLRAERDALESMSAAVYAWGSRLRCHVDGARDRLRLLACRNVVSQRQPLHVIVADGGGGGRQIDA